MYVGRIIISVLVLIVWGWIEFALSTTGTIITGQIAGKQFEPSNQSYVEVVATFAAFRGIGLILSLVGLGLLLLIWWKPLQVGVKAYFAALSSITILAIFIAYPGTARAYYDQKDFTEAYTILPNESAFWIPDVGDNKANQAQLDSEDYLKANKLSVKRFIVPHQKLSGTGSFWDYYVPAGRLIIVDRTPYSREWVASSHRGTSARDESFPCQTKEGLNISAAVSIGVSVAEANAAKFLYRFGVLPVKGARNDPAVIFTSVYYGRNLAEVMDDVGRKKVQTLVCEQIAARTFDQANNDTNPIMTAVQKAAADYFASVGITLEFIGWADTFTFDQEVQKAVNDAYRAAKIGAQVQVLQALNQLNVQDGLAKGLDKHGLPIVVTPEMLQALAGMAAKVAPAGK